MKKRYILCSSLILLGMQSHVHTVVNAQEITQPTNSVRVGSRVVYNDIKYKVLTISEGKGTVELGTGLPVEFKQEQDGKPFEVPEQFTVNGVTYTVISIAEEALAFYPDELGTPTYYPSKITVPSTVTTIQKRAFSSSKAETVIFKENSQLEMIADSAFTNSELKHITIPKSVKVMGDRVFNFSDKLETVTFENDSTLKTMGKEVFSNLMALREITLPASLEDVGSRPFRDAKNIETINIAESNNRYKTVNGALYDKTESTLLYYPSAKKDVEYTVDAGTTTIGEYAFANNAHLEKIILPEGIKTIGEYAFKDVNKLKTLTLPKSVETIGKLAFFGNLELKALTILSGTFTEYTLNGLPALETLTLGESVKELPNKFLTGALDKLKKVYINYTGDDFKMEKESFDMPEAVEFVVKSDKIKAVLVEKLGDKHNIVVEEAKTPDLSDNSNTPDMPKDDTIITPDVPKTPEQPDVSDIPSAPDDNHVPNVPNAPDNSHVPNISKTPNVSSDLSHTNMVEKPKVNNTNTMSDTKKPLTEQKMNEMTKNKNMSTHKNSLPRTGTAHSLLFEIGSVLLLIGYALFKKRV